MKNRLSRVAPLAFVLVMALSFVVFADNNPSFAAGSKQADAQSISVTQTDVEEAIESVNQEIRDTVSMNTSQFSETTLSELGRTVSFRSNAIDPSYISAESLKENWAATAYMQIQEEAPVGSTYPLVYKSDDQKTMIMLYKNPDGSIVKKTATYQEPKDGSVDLYQMYRISESKFSGKPLPKIMRVQ